MENKVKRELLSPHLYRNDFACQGIDCCGESSPVHPFLVMAVEQFCLVIGKPVSINSGFRCRKHNAEIEGSAPDSYHCKGMAADLSVRGEDPGRMALVAGRISAFGGIKAHSWGIHVDIGPRRKL